MTTDTSNKLVILWNQWRVWRREVRAVVLSKQPQYVPAWTWERIMARSAFIVVCLLLVGVWLHPYVSRAFEGRRTAEAVGIDPVSPTRAANTATMPQMPQTLPPFTIVKGREGFWRLAKAEDGVWWFVSPEGTREFLNTVTTVHPFQEGRDKNGVHFVSRDWNGSIGKYDGDLHAWADKTLARIQEVGFKGLGAWCHPVFHEFNVPITRDLNIWKHHGPGKVHLYHPEWASIAEDVIIRATANLKDNINLVGYYTDNELDWSDSTIGPSVYFDHLPVGDPNRVEVINTIQTLWPTIEEYNAAWGAKLTTWADLEQQPKLNREATEAYARLFSVWLEKAATHYFKTTSELLKKHDPNHLNLGVRFAGFAPSEVVRASRNYTDAQSINYYVSDAQLDPDLFKRMYEESGQPIILSEYGFHSLDGRSGNRNTFGFQAQVVDQQARAEAYALFTTRLARLPYFVGADWFQWMDEPPSGRNADGEDVNFGIVDVDDRLYKQLADAVRETSGKLNALHALSSTDKGEDIFRSTFAVKPTAHVMKLDRPITINGELSDWSELNRISGIRRSQTVGLDRSDVRMPNVFMGWRDEGLYLAAEVYDQYIETVGADGRWWTRDCVEFWISTRPVPKDQQVYNPNCHQFFYIPSARPTDGSGGIVGQWHRPGDALTASLIPHPEIRQSTRVMPGRYVVEIFIPSSALHGWDPVSHPEMAFNLHVKNFHMAVDYFWSAPKEAMTQMRPNTWGKIILVTPQVASAE